MAVRRFPVGVGSWIALIAASWFVLIPSLLGYLAGWEIDRTATSSQHMGRIGLTALGAVVGMALAWGSVLRPRRPR